MSEIKEHIRAILTELGEDPDRPGLQRTSERVEKSLRFLTQGYAQSATQEIGNALFHETHNNMVLVRDIEFYSLCEHHMLPFYGKAHVAYIPNMQGRITGLSKIARLVDGFARRPQVQERLTQQIAAALNKTLEPRGVLVVLEAEHLCMSMRGIRKSGSSTVTSSVHGVFRENAASRQEAMQFITGR